MRRILCTVFAVQLAAAVANGQNDDSFRFFFDTIGGTEQGLRDPANLAFTNPTVDGAGRLYLYLQYGNGNLSFSGVDLTVTVSGPGMLTGGNLYNHELHLLSSNISRWMIMPHKTFGPNDAVPMWAFGSSFTVGPGAGARNTGDVDAQDTHFDRTDGGNGFGTTLLGFVDVEATAGAGNQNPGQVFLQNGSGGNAGQSGGDDGLINASDNVYFGFGDAAVKNKKGALEGGPGGPTPLAEAFIVPEPISLVLLALGMIGLSRRR